MVGECRSNVSSPGKVLEFDKLANFWRVLEFDKFAGEWPLLKIYLKLFVKLKSLIENDLRKINPKNRFFSLQINIKLTIRIEYLKNELSPGSIRQTERSGRSLDPAAAQLESSGSDHGRRCC